MRKLHLCFALLCLLATKDAQAANYVIEFCVEYATNYGDLGGDYWTSNVNRKARGVYLEVERIGTWFNEFNDYVDDNGCTTLTLSDLYEYQIFSTSEAETGGVESIVHPTTGSGSVYAWVFFSSGTPFEPDLSDGTETLVINATTASAQLAVGSTTMWTNNLGLGSSTPLVYVNDDCCNFVAGEISAATFSKTVITHETGHAIGYRREGNNAPNYSYNANEDNCDGDDVDQDKHAQVSKEWQSGAAVEGFADVISAWAWNNTSQGDCTYDRHYASDFDLNGTTDNAGGQVNCEGIPTTGLASYVTARDWLADVVNADDDDDDGFQCNGSLTARSSQLDWLRYGWDMLNDESVPIEDFVDIYDDANPQSWDIDDNSSGSYGSTSTSDDVIVRWEASADSHPNNYTAEHDAQKDNGQDH